MRYCAFLLSAILVGGLPVVAEETVVQTADSRWREVSVGQYDQVFSHVVDGGTWKTTFVLTNLTSEATPFLMAFYANDGTPLTLPIVGVGDSSAISGTIAPNGTLILETAGLSDELRQGSAIFFCLDRPASDVNAKPVATKLGGAAIFRQRVPGRPDFEAVVPVSALDDSKLSFPFDNSAGFVTGIALINANSSANSMLLVIRDEEGRIIGQDVFTLAGRNKSVFVVTEKYPQTAGKRGSIEVSAPMGGLGGLGLRFNPNGSFTSMHPTALRSSTGGTLPGGVSECYPAVESQIDGSFEGWSGDSIFKLMNGQIWQQAEFSYTYHYEYLPYVVIYPTARGCKMKVDGVRQTILVKRIK